VTQDKSEQRRAYLANILANYIEPDDCLMEIENKSVKIANAHETAFLARVHERIGQQLKLRGK
jgi:hypothetical protein